MSSHRYSRTPWTLCRLLSLTFPDRIVRRIFPSTPSLSIDGPSGSKATRTLDLSSIQHVGRVSPCERRCKTVNILPDDVLIHIFHFDRAIYLDGLNDTPSHISYYVRTLFRHSWQWRRLGDVCRRWRSAVFASPNSLNLRLICNPALPSMEFLQFCPSLPIVFRNMVDSPLPDNLDLDSAIMHRDHVCEIHFFHLTSLQLQRLASAMQEQLPALTHLTLDLHAYHYLPQASVLPDGFLGGSAPRLQYLTYCSIPFPALPKLLLTATDLVDLTLARIPHNGYFSPETIAGGLAVSANLKYLTIAFESPLSLPDRDSRRPPPPTRSVLPALTQFYFKGVSEYLEDLVTRIDTPFLVSLRVTFFNQLVFNIPQLPQFMRRTPKFRAINKASVCFDPNDISVRFSSTRISDECFCLTISCRKLDWQLSSLAQVLSESSSFLPIYMAENLFVEFPHSWHSDRHNDVDVEQWLEICHPFTAVKKLYISERITQHFAYVLQELVGEMATDLLPALESLFLEEVQPSGSVREDIEKFVSARALSGRPIAVSQWDRAEQV